MKPNLLVACFALVAAGCGGSDSEAPLTDSGVGAPDSGSSMTDSGTMTSADSGSLVSDSGSLVSDSGATTSDGGTENDGATGDATTALVPFSIRFAARAGDETVACGTPIAGVGMGANQRVDLVDFRFYVHDIELLTAAGDAVPLEMTDMAPWQNNGVALLDFEDGTGLCTGNDALNEAVQGMAPPGDYTGIRFKLGVPFDQNHQDADAAEAPLNVSPLFWSWQGGYKFARIDTSTLNALEARVGFNIHLGSTGCDGGGDGNVTMCASPNRPTFELAEFDPATSVIVADYAALVGTTDLSFNTQATPAGCMSGPTDPECSQIFPSFGLAFNGAGADQQDLFRVESN